MRHTILFILIFLGVKTYAQIDSIDLKLANLSGDSAKCLYIANVAELIRHPDTNIIPYLDKALEISKQQNMFVYGKVLKSKGMICYYNLDITQSIIYLNKASNVFKFLGKKDLLIDSYNMLANNYFYIKRYDKAIMYNRLILNLAHETGNYEKQATAYRQIGINFTKLKLIDSAYKYFNKALDLGFKYKINRSCAYNLSDLGEYYFMRKNYNKAITYQKKALKYAIKDTEKTKEHALGLIYQRMAASFRQINMLDSALTYIYKALTYKNITKLYAVSCKIAAQIYIDKKNYDLALKYLDTARILNTKISLYSMLDEIYELYTNIYLRQNNYAKFELYNKIRLLNKDSIEMQRLSYQVENLKILTAMEKFKKEIEQLTYQRLRKERELRIYKVTILMGSILSFITLLFAIILYFNLRKIKTQNKIISDQKDELDKQAADLIVYKNHLEKLVDERTKQLNIAKEKAEESDKLKTEFLHNISHEIRTPMNAIMGFSSLMADDETLTEQQKQYIEIINDSGKQLMKIIHDIMEISKLKTEKTELRYSKVCLQDLFSAIITDYSIDANKKNLNISFEKQQNIMEDCINIDSYKVKRIVSILIDNAIKFTKEGFVKLTYKTDENNLYVSVEDSGIGIDEKNFETIFKRFSQANKKISEKAGGVGLGLSIAKRYTEILGGSISVKSEIGKGSIFTLIIPHKTNPQT